MYRFLTKKDWIKFIRTILEVIVFAVLITILIRTLFVLSEYTPYTPAASEVETTQDSGFTALSYFGVDRNGTDTLISTALLEEHLTALKNCGFVTVTQEDILEYYKEGKPLPEQALFLLFEDGRTDTAVFSQPILEDVNYIGTICTYADKFAQRDNKFLKPKDIDQLLDNTYWELGSNGYRLAYINVFDRYDRFLGQMTSNEFILVNQYLERDYNHYLMDYIRDANDMPVETYQQMRDRINADYTLMEQIYTEEFDQMPGLYLLMHSNSDRFGNEPKVSEVNEENMTRLFQMNYNREGDSHNTGSESIYDLTRMQVQAFWNTNHLLMRLWDDLDDAGKARIRFVEGDPKRSANWDLLEGAAEFKNAQIILTTMPNAQGLIRLKNQENLDDLTLSVTLEGNLLGSQTVRLRADENGDGGIAVTFLEKEMTITEDGNVLAKVSLDDLLGVTYASVEQDKRDALAQIYTARAKNASGVAESLAYHRDAIKAEKTPAASVAEGAEPYIPKIGLHDMGSWQLKLQVENDQLTVWVNDQLAAAQLPVASEAGGGICLESSWDSTGYNQRNLSEDVYDGIFTDLVITGGGAEKTPVLDNRLQGMEAVLTFCKDRWDRIVNWFIIHL